MGTKVFFLQGHRDLSEDSSSCSSCYGDNLVTNGLQYYNGLVSSYPVRDIDALKRRMIEHEAIFRSQLYELHRLYRIQKNLTEEIKRNESHRLRVSTEPSSSSSRLGGYQLPSFDSGHGRTWDSGVLFRNFPASCTEEYNTGLTGLPTLKEYEPLDPRPSKKARKNLFDLRIPADEYTDNIIELADLNEPIQIEEETAVSSSINFLGHGSAVNVPPHELTTRNGHYHGSASEARGPQVCCSPLSGFGYRSCGRVNDLCRKDEKQTTVVIDLNEEVDLTVMDEKDEGEAASPHEPPPHTKEAVVVSSEIIETEATKKVTGVPIFETNALGNDRSIVLPTERSVRFLPVLGNDDVGNEQGRMIDINIECEPDDDDVTDEDEPTLEEQNQANVGAFRNQIDLNSCATDIDDPCMRSFGSNVTTVKRIFENGVVEAPPRLQESEDDLAGPFRESKNKPMQDEFLQNAAEVIFSMSSFCPQAQVKDNIKQQPSETSLSESLLWFVDVVSSYAIANKLENTNKESCEEIDDFEAMTLGLQEMKEEDYLCRPFIPESQEIKETSTKVSLLARSRRGHSRRGRRRKDFQRDILPCLATLSRHEVTKDLRTFC